MNLRFVSRDVVPLLLVGASASFASSIGQEERGGGGRKFLRRNLPGRGGPKRGEVSSTESTAATESFCHFFNITAADEAGFNHTNAYKKFETVELALGESPQGREYYHLVAGTCEDICAAEDMILNICPMLSGYDRPYCHWSGKSGTGKCVYESGTEEGSGLERGSSPDSWSNSGGDSGTDGPKGPKQGKRGGGGPQNKGTRGPPAGKGGQRYGGGDNEDYDGDRGTDGPKGPKQGKGRGGGPPDKGARGPPTGKGGQGYGGGDNEDYDGDGGIDGPKGPKQGKGRGGGPPNKGAKGPPTGKGGQGYGGGDNEDYDGDGGTDGPKGPPPGRGKDSGPPTKGAGGGPPAGGNGEDYNGDGSSRGPGLAEQDNQGKDSQGGEQ